MFPENKKKWSYAAVHCNLILDVECTHFYHILFFFFLCSYTKRYLKYGNTSNKFFVRQKRKKLVC